MENNDKFEAFLDRVLQRPLPNSPMARIRTLAKELAEGAAEGLWGTNIYMESIPADSYYTDPEELAKIHEIQDREQVSIDVVVPESTHILDYLDKKWRQKEPSFALLEIQGYLTSKYARVSEPSYRQDKYWQLTKAAFDIIEHTEPPTVFISYKRSESSTLALLTFKSLQFNGIAAFLDKDLKAGKNWHASIEENVKQATTFILLLGKETLKSDIVRKEISWALQASATIIPIWHNGFTYNSAEWDLEPEIDAKLRSTQAIIVLIESASGYEKALVELLDRFVVTP